MLHCRKKVKRFLHESGDFAHWISKHGGSTFGWKTHCNTLIGYISQIQVKSIFLISTFVLADLNESRVQSNGSIINVGVMLVIFSHYYVKLGLGVWFKIMFLFSQKTIIRDLACFDLQSNPQNHLSSSKRKYKLNNISCQNKYIAEKCQVNKENRQYWNFWNIPYFQFWLQWTT